MRTSDDFKHAGIGSLSQTSTRNRPSRKTADKAINIHPGSLCRRLDDGQLDHPTSAPRRATLAVVAAVRTGLKRLSVEAMAPWFMPPWNNASMSPQWPITPQREQRRAGARCRQASASPSTTIRRNVKMLLEPRLLRDGLPDQCQAVDAGDDASPARWSAARRSDLAAARRAPRFFRPVKSRLEATALKADGLQPERHQRHACAPATSCSPAAPSTRRPCCCAARRRTRPACSGKRTFLHPVVHLVGALRTTPFAGLCRAPHSRSIPTTSSRKLPDRRATRLQTGSSSAPASGALLDHAAGLGRGPHARLMRRLRRTARPTLALMRDGFHPDSQWWPGQAAQATARRCSTIRSTTSGLGSGAPGAAGDGGDPVCRRCQLGDAGP